MNVPIGAQFMAVRGKCFTHQMLRSGIFFPNLLPCIPNILDLILSAFGANTLEFKGKSFNPSFNPLENRNLHDFCILGLLNGASSLSART